jgi:hypothetical protein
VQHTTKGRIGGTGVAIENQGPIGLAAPVAPGFDQVAKARYLLGAVGQLDHGADFSRGASVTPASFDSWSPAAEG